MSTAPEPPSRSFDPARRRGTDDFRLARRLVKPALNRVVRGDATFQLEPKIMQVLVALAERPGEVITRERLFRDVWEGAYVTEDVLTRAVGELRRLFDDDPAQPRVIETIRKTGYRLLLAPEAIVADAAALPGQEAKRGNRLPIAAVLGAGLILAAALAFLGGRAWLRSPRESGPMRIRPLASAPGIERDPALAPDGTRVAFAWNGGSGDGMSI